MSRKFKIKAFMPTKQKKVTSEAILSHYTEYVLEHEKLPKSVYKFCKVAGIKEADFYIYFPSIKSLEKSIWQHFYTNTLSLVTKNEAYEGFSNKDKMLTFFYTMFEVLTLNRSYVLFVLENEKQEGLKKLAPLKGLRKSIKHFTKDLIEDGNAEKNSRLTKHNPQLFSEGAWLQFLFLLKFWMNDESAGFEKTDMAIEKSVNTIFDVFDNTPLDNILDFGKFLYKETFC